MSAKQRYKDNEGNHVDLVVDDNAHILLSNIKTQSLLHPAVEAVVPATSNSTTVVQHVQDHKGLFNLLTKQVDLKLSTNDNIMFTSDIYVGNPP